MSSMATIIFLHKAITVGVIRAFARAKTQGPLLGYFNFCLGYFYAGIALELPWKLKKSTSTVGCPVIFKLLK